ncbi:MAG: AAA family ATPase, partial [Bacteroidota bacterium]
KILRLNIRNLNSLRGEQLIDFTAPPLADHNLYAIVGPTGAGKTTILDAITLALYGQTERNKSELDRKDGSASVLTYGEGECLAELEYLTAAGRFRSAWSRQRAHKKPDGNLTASRHSISQFNPETQEWDILATKKREVATRTQEVVGLDYERFVRSVMLTQGDFARFLKSDAGNKAEILEKITGTEIYRDLSIAAFTRAKLAREAHQRATAALAATPPLGPEARTDLEARLAERQTVAAEGKKALAELTAQLGHYATHVGLQTKVATAQAESDRLATAWQAAATDRDRLSASEALQPLRSELDAVARLRKELSTGETALATLTGEISQLQAAVDTTVTNTKTAREKLREFHEKLPGREKKFATVAAWEQEIAQLSGDLTRDERTLVTRKAELIKYRERQQKLTGELTTIRTALAGLKPEEIREQLVDVDATLPNLQQELIALDTRRQNRKTADRLATEKAAAAGVHKELTTATTTLTTAEKQLKAATTELADRREVLNQLRLSASLSEHKQNLEPGEACPVCGATDHPALANFTPVTDSALERTKTDVNRALAAEENALRLHKAAGNEVAKLQRRYDGHQALVDELTAQIGEEEKTSLAELDQQRAALVNRLTAATATKEKLRGLQGKLPQLTALTTELATVGARTDELHAESQKLSVVVTANQQAIAAKKASIQAEVGKHTAEECREMTRKHKEKLTAELAAAEKAEVDQRGQLSAAASRHKLLQTQREGLTKELATVRQTLTAKLRPSQLDETTARQTLLSESETRHLRQRLQKLTTERATATTVLTNLTAELVAAEKVIADLPPREALEKERATRELAVTEADRQTGALQEQLRQDDARIAGTAARRTELEGLRKDVDRWTVLAKLIGSADGKKFRSYAQAITLQRLIEAGNHHLHRINPRYRMDYAPPASGGTENLEIIVVDTYHDDNRRTMATLSGGETFLISLALALGLSELASGRSLIQSLFIDEGFGTLDGKTLDQAMNTLEQLQASGKTIGLISHVPQLRERITCKIELEPVGDGFSRIRVSG